MYIYDELELKVMYSSFVCTNPNGKFSYCRVYAKLYQHLRDETLKRAHHFCLQWNAYFLIYNGTKKIVFYENNWYVVTHSVMLHTVIESNIT